VSAEEEVQRAQLPAWQHDARVKAQHTEVARAHAAYRARPTQRNFDRFESAQRDYRNTVFGTKSREPIDPKRFPQASNRQWWQVWKRDNVNLPPPGPEYPETRRTGARVIQHPNGLEMYALVARDSHGNPMVMSHDVDPINLVVMSVQMGYGQAINLGTTLPTDPGERELWAAATNSFDAVMREHNKRQASLHDEPEARLAAELREPTLDALTDAFKVEFSNYNPDDPDDPEAKAEAGDRPGKPKGPSDAAAADMPDEHPTLEADDLADIDLSIHEPPGPPGPPEAEASNVMARDPRADAAWQATLEEMRAARGLDGDAYTAAMDAIAERKATLANRPSLPPAHAPGEESEAKKAARISDTHFANRGSAPEANAASVAKATASAAATRRAEASKKKTLGKVLRPRRR
jgi:hypothetical protein